MIFFLKTFFKYNCFVGTDCKSAVSGLMGTEIFNSIHPEGSTSRQRIKNRIASEQSGHPVTEGGITQNNIGQPCN